VRRVRLGDVVTVSGGGTPRKSNPTYYGGSVPWVTPKDMKSDVISDSLIRLTEAGVANSPAKLVKPGSVLVVVRSGVLKHTLPVALTTVPVTLNQDMKALTPTEDVVPGYLARLLKASQQHVLAWVRATTADNFPIQNLLDLAIELPPLDEQRRIAAILDQADGLRAKRRQARNHLDELTQSIFLDMFGREDYEFGTVADAAEVQGGLQVTSKRKSLPLEVPYLRVANVFRNRLDLGEVKTLRATERELDRTRLYSGDLLIVEGHGNPLEIGRAAIWTGDVTDCVHQNHLIRVRFDAGRVVPEFGVAWLNSRRGRQHLLRAAKTTSGLNTISTSNVKSVPVPLVSLEQQHLFVSATKAAVKLAGDARKEASEIDSLFESLTASAFTSSL